MISLDGAALIATVYPVGILILVFEMRSLLNWLSTRVLKHHWQRLVVALAIVSVVGAAAASTAICVLSVSTGDAVDDAAASLVFVSGFALYLLVIWGIGGTVALAFRQDD